MHERRRMLLTIVALLLAFVAFLFLTQRELIYFPRAYATRDVGALLPKQWEALAFDSDGARQYAYWAPGPVAGAEDAVYFVFSGNATLALDWFNEVRQAQAAHPERSFLLVEYPGYGQNGGRPTRARILAASLQAREALRQRLGIEDAVLRRRTRVIGHSLGAAAGLDFACRAGAREIVLLAPFTSLIDMARRVVGWPLCLLARDRFDNRARLTELAALPDRPPMRIYHGGADSVIPVEMGRALGEAFRGWVEYQEKPGVGHNELVEDLASILDGTPTKRAVGE